MPWDRRTFVAGSAALGAGALAGHAPSSAAQTRVPTFTDPLLNQPYIDVDEWRDTPVRHRYVHGGFKGTDARFAIQFPPKEQYLGRFFHHNTAVSTSELEAGNIWGGSFAGFCFDSGGAAVVTNQGGFKHVPQFGTDQDATVGSYRVAAATAMYVRELANQMYGPHRCYGYAFGGSGGGYRTISCAENSNAFDGVVPYIHANAQSVPNGMAARARAQRTLKARLPQIADALEPGGSGDPYASLDAGERDILREVTRLGFPMRTWTVHDAMGIGALSLQIQGTQILDPSYFQDFWTKPGYLGVDRPQAFQGVRLQHRTKVTRVIMSDQAAAAGLRPGRSRAADPDVAWKNFQADYGAPLPVALEIETPPPAGSFVDLANIRVVSGASAGKSVVFGGMTGKMAMIQFSPAGGSFRDITDHIRVGDKVQIDNSNILAFETFYRHAMLTPDYYVANHLRRPDGRPIYPQRASNPAFGQMRGASATMPDGQFDCKMIVIECLLDWDAHPWAADWYRSKVREHLGSAFGENYRLYYIDHATHGQIPDPTRTVPYSGALQQALRDVAAWAERGAAPPQETSYRVEEGQVLVPPAAAQRRGIQPVVTLQANGGVRADVKAGQPVEFTAVIETPPNGGSIVSAEWDFDATAAVVPGDANRFPVKEQFAPARRVALTRRHRFTKPGTYFPALRVHSHRQGNANTPYARVANLGRVRVVVT